MAFKQTYTNFTYLRQIIYSFLFSLFRNIFLLDIPLAIAVLAADNRVLSEAQIDLEAP